MANNTTFHSLTNVTPAYDTKRGKEFRAQVQGFAAKDAEVRTVSGRYVVSTFMNLSGAKDDLNTGLGLAIEESSYEGKNGTYLSIPANFSVWTDTQAEAEAIAAKLTKNARFSAPVRVGYRVHEGKTYIELTRDEIFFHASTGGSAAPAANTAAVQKAMNDDDLPF
jgi:hypothetical protein